MIRDIFSLLGQMLLSPLDSSIVRVIEGDFQNYDFSILKDLAEKSIEGGITPEYAYEDMINSGIRPFASWIMYRYMKILVYRKMGVVKP